MNKPLIVPGALSSAFDRYAPAVENSEPVVSTEIASKEASSLETAALRVRADNICPYCERDGDQQQMQIKICAGVQCYVCSKHRHVSPSKNGM